MSGGDKPFASTPARRERARRDGDLPRAPELPSVAAFAAALAATVALMPLLAADALRGALLPLVLAALAPAAAAACAAAATTLTLAGGLRVRAPEVDPRRLDPVAGLKRLAGPQAWIAAARAVLAFVAPLAAMLPLARELPGGAGNAGSPAGAALLAAGAVLRGVLIALAAGVAFAAADYALARRRWLAGLRMSAAELKREAREQEGDPHAKARRRTLHRGVGRGSVERTREASFVVVNPTHLAVALRYDPPAVPVPRILVRAADSAALRVREIARACAIPLVHDVALARLLFAGGSAGCDIPPATFVAVAHVVAALAREGLL